MKLKIKLNRDELQCLYGFVSWALVQSPIEELRADTSVFLINSVLYELHEKIHKQYKDVSLFPTKSDKTYSVTLTRSQALAYANVDFYYYLKDLTAEGKAEPGFEYFNNKPAIPTTIDYISNVLNSIYGEIHKAFLV